MIIAIDGPAASGKSSTAARVAAQLGFRHIDTGAMYRAVTLYMLEHGVDISDTDAVLEALPRVELSLAFEGDNQRVILSGVDVSDRIRTLAVNENVSQVSAIPAVRRRLVELQRQAANDHDVVLEGRDIGTVVFPNADLKIFMIADVHVRAQRRQQELESLGIQQDLAELEKDLIARDKIDSSRVLSPLKSATDAVELDTSKLTIDQQVAFIVNQAKQMIAKEERPFMAEEEKKDAPQTEEQSPETSETTSDAVEMTPAEDTQDKKEETAASEPETETETKTTEAKTESGENAETPAESEKASDSEETAEESKESSVVNDEPARSTRKTVKMKAKASGEPLVQPVVDEEEAEKASKKIAGLDKRSAMNDIFNQIRTIKPDQLAETIAEESEEVKDLSFLLDRTIADITPRTLVEGRVISVGDREVLVDIGFKSEGLVSREEFKDDELPKVGEKIELFLDTLEDDQGQTILSKRKADFMRVWTRIKDVYDNGDLINGTITRRIKGGMVVNVMDIDAFLPGSQLDVRPIHDFDAYIGKSYDFKIVKLNETRKNIVLSRKDLLEEKLQKQRAELLKNIEIGQVLEGRVKNITDFGVFVDLGGVDGLLHITDLSWGRVNHPSEVVDMDDEITVKVIDYDEEKQRVSLGFKQLQPHPWEHVEQKYPVGSAIKGKVVSITNYGIFVELEEGVEGLVHISEISWTQHIKHPSEIYSVGDEIETVVLSIAPEDRKVSLGVKQLKPDPWTLIEDTYIVGTLHTGTVKNLTQFGAFVELEEGIEGLIHISDLSWTRKVRHPKEVLKRGDEVEVRILDIAQDQRKISLGLKQAGEDPWPQIEQEFAVNSTRKGKVIKLLDKGIILELEGTDVEGLIPLASFNKKDRKAILDKFQVDQEVEVKVMEIDPNDKKILVSHAAAIKDKERAVVNEYLRGQKHDGNKLDIPDEVVAKIKEAAEEETEKKVAAAEKRKAAKAKEEEKARKKADAEDAAESEAEEQPEPKAKSKSKSKSKAKSKDTEEASEPEKDAAEEETTEGEEKPEPDVETEEKQADEASDADSEEAAEDAKEEEKSKDDK
ncbi:MAG: 30S ribosomal protein S1 [Candidatus Marinimicrobia bacterium]|nr:30S ribosomal protein S1 [Candidatus Neomarinimicrobiota bacterium]